MSIIITDGQYYSDIANAIRTKAGTSDTFKPSEMAPAILTIPSGSGTDVSDTTATAADVLAGKYFHVADGTKTAGTLNFNWMGENPEFVSRIYSMSTTLDQTSYNGWSPSTTAKSIVASSTLSTKQAVNLANYDYFFVWFCDCDVAYDNTWSPSAASCIREVSMRTQSVIRRPQSTSVPTSTFSYNATQEAMVGIYFCNYYSSASATSITYTSYSPCYLSAITAFALSSTANDSINVTIKTPVLSARCSGTYFSTTNAAKVDQANTTIKLVCDMYRVKARSNFVTDGWGALTYIFNHPL